ncbi:hypothetical protein HKBW3S03_01349 [Candidatus Hakubella thermalkaliphila]|uniref:Uncharacterized protein n=1 Tax=Candidatus Hakubella thermalkaliphila TaxID=2754717 RepID=A0A6V8NVG6_9ACTN|nr:hypothetical protein HKBW3S03_01349 [Candidatus Hakubella thermalkaliphila]GFP24137.1 hypothetical protein HKBW3S09_01603 [Candidatus Hakubella thermalkaliphila]GFP31394.1 hypothetical protein HKBW3S34_02314 [Candidatus Hakubella thermalkaliphila]GFP39743.1 hypothetical protein HKBW3S47_01441 [Candidatus Hakubella thermalkaliphila]
MSASPSGSFRLGEKGDRYLRGIETYSAFLAGQDLSAKIALWKDAEIHEREAKRGNRKLDAKT